MKLTKYDVIPYVLASIALVVGAFYDYQITSFFYHPQSIYGVFFEQYALLPVLYLAMLTMGLLWQRKKHILYLLLAQGVSLYLCQSLWISIVLLLVTIAIAYKIPVNWRDKYLPFLIFYCVVLFSSILFTTIAKELWGRIRFRDMVNVEQFCVWYKPCGLSGNRSFPSGHTTTFTAIVCFLQCPYIIQKGNRYKALLWICVVMMPLGRMIMGAHFLSDTAMGFIVTYSFYLGYRELFKKKRINL